MLVMASTGTILALRQSLTNANVTGGLMTIYFVVTALTTVRTNKTVDLVASALAALLVVVEAALAWVGFRSPSKEIDGAPWFAVLFFSIIVGFAVIGDLRARSRGIEGPRRLARHLWRMCFGLFIATASFFSIEKRVARIFPQPLTTPLARSLPVLAVLVVMAWWLWRVRRPKRVLISS